MPVSLEEFGIVSGGFIRKLDSRNHWYPEMGDNDPRKRANLVSARIFNDPDNTYSLWLVNSSEDFMGVVVALVANATPQDRNLDFLWITEQELQQAGIQLKNIPEGKCLAVKDNHYEAQISQDQAKKLCLLLIENSRDSQRCKKKDTICIIDYYKSLGCYALVPNSQKCDCEIS
jgi:hypothetical protein